MFLAVRKRGETKISQFKKEVSIKSFIILLKNSKIIRLKIKHILRIHSRNILTQSTEE